jgi:hypothetical protein
MSGLAGIVFAVVLLLAALLAPLLLPVNLRMTATERGLIVEPAGLDRFWTWRRRIIVPAEQITSIRVLPRQQIESRGVRFPGAHLPGVITAGTYRNGDDQVFWDVRRGEELLVVYCRAGAPYRALVLEFPDPHAVLSRAQATLGR